jgi:hypothetical protein
LFSFFFLHTWVWVCLFVCCLCVRSKWWFGVLGSKQGVHSTPLPPFSSSIAIATIWDGGFLGAYITYGLPLTGNFLIF